MDQQTALKDIRLNRSQVFWFLTVVTICAFLLRFMTAYHTTSFFDISYYVSWSEGAATDLFGVFEKVSNMDYPPLFLFPLYFTGKLMQMDAVKEFIPYQMLALKGWQLLFDVAIVPLLYYVLRQFGELIGLGAAMLWAVNPTAIYNSAYWGQTDEMMMFLLVVTFFLLHKEKAVLAGCFMALACMMKYQSLYFAPLFALMVLTALPPKKILLTVAGGVGAVAAVFLPFCLRSGWDLPFKVYLGGYSQYAYASMNGFNAYAAMGHNFKNATVPVLGAISAETLSALFIVLAVWMLVFFYFTATEKSSWILGFFFMQTIYMFSSRMHERYQIPVIIFALMAAAWHKSAPLFACYVSMTMMTFLNHFVVLEKILAGDKSIGWIAYYDQIVVVLSFVNLILYLITFGVVLRILYRNGYRKLFDGMRMRHTA